MAIRSASAKFRAVAARYEKRANKTTSPALRDAYRQLTMGYMRLAVQQEVVEQAHSLIGRLEADDNTMASQPSVSLVVGNDADTPLKDEIADNQSTTARLQHAEEMKTIGLLAARIAHDFNNLLMAVGGSAELISTSLGSDSVSLPHVSTIQEAVRRGAALTGQLLAFGREPTLVPRSADYLPNGSNDTVPAQATRRPPWRPAPAASVFGSPREGRRILVLDDDKDVRETMTDILSRAGYTVAPFETALGALAEVSGPHRIDLMVVDFALPDMRGDRFAAKARLQRSEVPILFISGHPEPTSLQSEAFWLRKPFSDTALISMIEEALQATAFNEIFDQARRHILAS
jgi:CheY-like chemotaxis protein